MNMRKHVLYAYATRQAFLLLFLVFFLSLIFWEGGGIEKTWLDYCDASVRKDWLRLREPPMNADAPIKPLAIDKLKKKSLTSKTIYELFFTPLPQSPLSSLLGGADLQLDLR